MTDNVETLVPRDELVLGDMPMHRRVRIHRKGQPDLETTAGRLIHEFGMDRRLTLGLVDRMLYNPDGRATLTLIPTKLD